MEKNCWTCGHWLIGYGCTKDAEVRVTSPDYVCENWVEEGAEGTNTAEMERGDAE